MDSLTSKEKEVLGLLIKGLSNKQISGILQVSELTVKTHVQNILKKLQVKNRKELIYIAVFQKKDEGVF